MHHLVVARSGPNCAPHILRLCVPHLRTFQQAVRVHYRGLLAASVGKCLWTLRDFSFASLGFSTQAPCSHEHCTHCSLMLEALVLALFTFLIVIDDVSVNLEMPRALCCHERCAHCIFMLEAFALAVFIALIIADDFSMNFEVLRAHPSPWHLRVATSRPRRRDLHVSWLGAPHLHGPYE